MDFEAEDRAIYNRLEPIEAARRAGYNYVKTAGGYVKINEWTPYSYAPSQLRWISLYFDPTTGSIRETALEPLTLHPVVTGVWTLSRER